MKKVAVLLIAVLLLSLPSNGFLLHSHPWPMHHERAPNLLFWRWHGKNVIIEYSDVIKNNDSIVADVRGYIAVPPALPNQDIIDIEFDPKPQKIIKDQYGQEVAFYKFELKPGESIKLSWRVEARVYTIRYILLPFLVGNYIPPDIKEKYTADGEMYKIHDPYIQQIVKKVAANETNLLIKAIKLHDYVIRRLNYSLDNRWDDAPTVLKRGNGSCSEYCFAYIALCRAAGIPAKYKGGSYLAQFPPYNDTVFHRMVLIYLPNYGWIPVDMTFDEWIFHHYAFGFTSNRFFAFMTGGGASRYLNWTYNSHYESNAKLDVNSMATWHQWKFDQKQY